MSQLCCCIGLRRYRLCREKHRDRQLPQIFFSNTL
nr:MAG TPA: hypothetical protein [Caudoviricetes sp.]